MSGKKPSKFVSRFDRIWAQARRVQLSQALCWALLTALVGVALLAAVDYLWELPRELRLGTLVGIGVASVFVAIWLAVRSVRRWQRQATAAAIEQVFPQLGQRIRTTVQYGELLPGEIEEEGVATTLVIALEEDTVQRAEPLPLDAVVPWKRLALASLLAAAVGLGLAAASALNWEWRTAAQRTFLGDEPYTRIAVDPGNLTVREGESAVIHATVEGRTSKPVSFWSRRTDEQESEWVEEPLLAQDAERKDERTLTFEMPLYRVRHPLEYRFTAGATKSETYRVNVLYPLKISRIEAGLQSPAYTGLSEQDIEGGNIAGLAGSQVRLRVTLDRAPQVAWLELRELALRRKPGEPAARKLPLSIDGNVLTARFELASDQTYSVLARAADGMELPENKYRIRVQQDQPPQVWFESPAEALEVHSLTEILMRIRVSDDFGLTRAGIMFEVNNEEEYPLLAQDFAAAAKELKETGKLSPQTRATLEKKLPLEHFQLTQQDNVMYYAFAEDNRPVGSQRTESDLRFIDIRPFRRVYRLVDPMGADGMMMNQGPQLKSLEELIARQRYALNRTIQLARMFKRTGQADLAGVDALIKFEAELAKSTRELAEGLEARGIDETELLYQAEAAMLGATDSLSAGNYDTATLQQRDALKHLIEGRNRLQIFIQKNPDRRQIAQLRQFDRMQQQKLRRPKTDEEEAREVAERLKDLADREDFVYKTLAGIPTSGEGKDEGEAEASSKKEQPMTKPKQKDEKDKAAGSSKENGKSKSNGASKDDEKQSKKAESKKNGEKMASGDAESKKDMDREKSAAGKMSRQDLEDRQLDIALESRELEKMLGKLRNVTDLAKERMAAAAKAAEDAASALSRDATPEAREAAKIAEARFRELADQVKALLAQEQAERIAAAQRMAAELAREQQDFVDRLANQSEQNGAGGDQPKKKKDEKSPGMGKEKGKEKPKDEKMPGAGQAERIAEKAKTIADVLGAAAKDNDPEDQAAAKKVQEVVGTLKLDELIQRLDQLPGQVKSGKFEDAKATAGDGAERMEAAAEQLAMIHRAIVAPKVDELAKIEAKMNVLDDELDRLDTPTRITGWHRDATDLFEELDKLGIAKELRDQFIKEMQKAGWGPDLRWAWARTEGGNYAAPGAYRVLLSRLTASVRGRLQELMLGDLASSRDEPIPPQYQELVDRYYQILASEGKEQPKRAAPPRK